MQWLENTGNQGEQSKRKKRKTKARRGKRIKNALKHFTIFIKTSEESNQREIGNFNAKVGTAIQGNKETITKGGENVTERKYELSKCR